MHEAFGDYVITGVRNLFNGKTSYWISKRGHTVAFYCFSAVNEREKQSQMANWESYAKMFEERVKAL